MKGRIGFLIVMIALAGTSYGQDQGGIPGNVKGTSLKSEQELAAEQAAAADAARRKAEAEQLAQNPNQTPQNRPQNQPAGPNANAQGNNPAPSPQQGQGQNPAATPDATSTGHVESAPTKPEEGWPVNVTKIEDRLGCSVEDVAFNADPQANRLGMFTLQYSGRLPENLQSLPICIVRWTPRAGKEAEFARMLGDQPMKVLYSSFVRHPRLGDALAIFVGVKDVAASQDLFGSDGQEIRVAFTRERLQREGAPATTGSTGAQRSAGNDDRPAERPRQGRVDVDPNQGGEVGGSRKEAPKKSTKP